MRTTDVVDMVAELCRARKHVEPYDVNTNGTTWQRRHPSIVPSLLAQLEHASPSGQGGERSGGYESRPAASIEALDTLCWIDTEASRWLRVDFHQDDEGSTAACVAKLGSLLPSLEAPVAKVLRADIARWWTRARVVTGWDVAAFQPDNTCPACAKRGTLRIRTFGPTDVSGFCTEWTCGATWDATTVGLLAEHIRTENREDEDDEQPTLVDVEPAELVELFEAAVVLSVPAEQNRGW